MQGRFKSATRIVAGLSLLSASLVFVWATAAHAVDCTTANHLSGSQFEIDVNGNLKVDGASPCIDWLTGGSGSAMRGTVLSKSDKPTGSGDDSFGKGTAENDPNPTIVDGSIPPNKSDLKTFGVFTENAANGKFLHLFWSRIQNPSGTTNMDFELNQKFCDPSATPTNCANNGSGVTPETPLRTAGDKLITYDLSKGGTVPVISIRTWSGSAWGSATVVSGGADPSALGSVNTSAMVAADTGGLGSQDAFTFGEAALAFSTIFPSSGECGTFGSAYLKSRSSDSFNAELKDFIAPEAVHLTNCADIVTSATQTQTIGGAISDTATLSGVTANAGGTITFHLYSDATCTTEVTTGLTPVAVSGPGEYNSGNYTPTAVGTYKWIASYSGDLSNSPASGACGDAGETSTVNKKQPAISTSATQTQTIGGAISDTATLSGATSDAGGTITFRLYSDAQCSTEVTTGLTPVSVSGNGNYNSGNFTPSTVGTYYWIASYSGDAKNFAVSGACGDTGETSTVNKAGSSISTAQTLYPQDSATITASAGGPVTGTVTFSLYGPGDAACSANPVFTQTVTLVNGSAATNNTTFGVTAGSSGTYRWIVVYSGDSTHNGTTSACGTEQFTATVANS